jgi:hypothetical protein
MTQEDWHDALRKSQLTERVPSDVREVFEEARETMQHGICSLALFTRGMEHALRAAEAAVAARSQTAGVPMLTDDNRPTSFAFLLAKLKKLKILTRTDLRTWTGIRGLRNFTAHPEQPFRLPPAVTIGILGNLAAAINQLFRHEAPQSAPRDRLKAN